MGRQALDFGSGQPNDGESLKTAFVKLDQMMIELYALIGAVQTQISALAGSVVTGFNGRSGAVSPTVGDYTAEQVAVTAVGGVTGDTVQAALAALAGGAADLATAVAGIQGQVAGLPNLSTSMAAVQQAMADLQAAAVLLSQKGVAGGVAPLNASNQIDPGYLPPMQDQTSRVTVADDAVRVALPVAAGFRIVEVEATGQKWAINPGADPAVPANWGHWADSAGGVASFKGRAGAVVPAVGDYAADQIASVAVGGLAATNVQAALAELDAEKAPLPASLPTVTPAGADRIAFSDASNGDSGAAATVDALFTNRILTAPELRGYVEMVAASVSVNASHTMGGLTAGNVKRFTLTGNVTLTLPAVTLNANTGAAISTILVQDATGGRTVTFAAPAGETIIWDGGGSQPAIAAGAGQETVFSFYKAAGSSHWKGVRTHKGG